MIFLRCSEVSKGIEVYGVLPTSALRATDEGGATAIPGDARPVVPTPSEAVLYAFSMPMRHNPAPSQNHIGMVVLLDLLLSLVHLMEGTLGIRPSSSCLWFYSKSG